MRLNVAFLLLGVLLGISSGLSIAFIEQTHTLINLTEAIVKSTEQLKISTATECIRQTHQAKWTYTISE